VSELSQTTQWSRLWMSRAPALSVAAFVFLYAVAASLYPGGTRAEPSRVGFSFLDNYWCDLLDEITYGGRQNPARRPAIVATVILSAGLAALWWNVPTLCPDARRRAAVARWSGLSSAMVIPFIASRLHNVAIDIAALLGVVAFVAAMSALGRRAGRSLVMLASVALALSLTNYTLWRTGIGLSVLPIVQKGAFTAFLGWIVALALRVEQRAGPSRR
jgi:hypothetical protein